MSPRVSNMAALVACVAAVLPAVKAQSYPAIDESLTPSTPSAKSVSYVDTSLGDYDRLALMVDDEPFFYNGIQLRADKLRDVWGMSQEAIGDLYHQVAEDGFTVVSTQLLWSEVQTDISYNASESTYIQGGSSADDNFASSSSIKFGYDEDSEDAQQLAYIKFDFSDYGDSVDAAKVRIYVDSDAISSNSFEAHLFGITSNDWDAASITWNEGAPNHDGAEISGEEGQDYFVASSSPSWDPISGQQYYDFDASSFVRDHCPDKIASFVLQATTDDDNGPVGAALRGVDGDRPPQLVLSDKARFDWTYVDTMIGWASDAGLKLELVWFGSDSTGWTMDSRVPYYVLNYIKVEEVGDDGSHVPVQRKQSDPAYGIYHFFMDKNDLDLRAQEKSVLKELMNHIAEYDDDHEDGHTLIGVDVANEPGVFGTDNPWHNPETWDALERFDSEQDFKDRLMWEFCTNLANAVKESNYPVWTRSNDVRWVSADHVGYNELMRDNGGVSLDFVGIDPYTDGFTSVYEFGHTTAFDGRDYATGANLPMIMENGGEIDTTQGLILASLAGGSFYVVYDFMGTDGHGMYLPQDEEGKDFTPTPRDTYVQEVRDTNNMLLKISRDLAAKLPNGAGGQDLDFLNVFWNETEVQTSFGELDITYQPGDMRSVAIADTRGSNEIALLSTGDATFVMAAIADDGIDSIESGSYSGSEWVKEADVDYDIDGDAISFEVAAYGCVRVVTA